jgi:hypothetical protein
VARALSRGGDEHFGAGDDLVAARMVLADPGLVIVQPVEMDQKLHVALERQQRVFRQRMKRREENAGLQKSVVHGRLGLLPDCPVIPIVATTGRLDHDPIQLN